MASCNPILSLFFIILFLIIKPNLVLTTNVATVAGRVCCAPNRNCPEGGQSYGQGFANATVKWNHFFFGNTNFFGQGLTDYNGYFKIALYGRAFDSFWVRTSHLNIQTELARFKDLHTDSTLFSALEVVEKSSNKTYNKPYGFVLVHN